MEIIPGVIISLIVFGLARMAYKLNISKHNPYGTVYFGDGGRFESAVIDGMIYG